MPGRARPVAALAMALLVPAAILTVAGPGHSLRAAAWPTAGLAVLAAAWLAGLLALCPRQTEPGIRQLPRSWRGAYYAGLFVLLAGPVRPKRMTRRLLLGLTLTNRSPATEGSPVIADCLPRRRRSARWPPRRPRWPGLHSRSHRGKLSAPTPWSAPRLVDRAGCRTILTLHNVHYRRTAETSCI